MENVANGILKFITCGSVDDGKSTLIGHILYASKLLYADQKQALLLDSQVGSRGGKIDYSLLLDGLMAEREQGITIDVAYRYFSTEKRSFIVADTPGHEEYTRNMAVGASFADLAIILVDAKKGILVQTRRHARICVLMGIRHFIFTVNKMDLIGFEKERFDAISQDISTLCQELGIRNAVIIPVSATEGDNVTTHSANMPWYQGLTLIEQLETTEQLEDAPESGFYMPVQRVCRPDHTFRGFQGQIEAGVVSVGDTLTALPSEETVKVKSIYATNRVVDTARVGQPVTIQLDREVDVSRGCVLCQNAQLKITKRFTATLLWMDAQILRPGQEYWVKLGTKLAVAVVERIRYKVDINTGEHVNATKLKQNEVAQCEITLADTVVLSPFQEHKTLGELIFIDRTSYNTVACGVVEHAVQSKQESTALIAQDRVLNIQLFDSFYYHIETQMVLRQATSVLQYNIGEILPIEGNGYRYPQSFDIAGDGIFAHIREGVFTGFGARDSIYPLVNTDGIAIQDGSNADFGKYRKVLILEKDGEAINAANTGVEQ